MPKPKTILNWSGGKDCSMALQKILRSDSYDVSLLFTTINAKFDRITVFSGRIYDELF